MDSKKILNLVTIVMFVITVVLLGLFMFGGEVPVSYTHLTLPTIA